MGLPLQLVLDLGARTILLVNEFILALCIGVLLLHANHLLDLSGTHVLSIAVLIEHLPVRLLFILRFNCLLFRLLFSHINIYSHCLLVLLFNLLVHLSSRRDLCHLVLLAFNLGTLHVHIAAALAHNVVGPFAGLINLFDSLQKY